MTAETEKKTPYPQTQPLVELVRVAFMEQFGRPATIIVAAPGRVNLIGEHIDYNDGFVLPLAIERDTVIAADYASGSNEQALANVLSLDVAEMDSILLDEKLKPGRGDWREYVTGVLAGFQQREIVIPAFDAVIGSTVPVGGGLSSSAALEVATATLLEELCQYQLDKREKSLLCQRAEHEFAGVPCGIMDQFSSVFGRADELMLLDCKTQQIEPVPMPSDDVCVLITNSNVKHELSGGEYAERREQCASALKKLEASSWREVSLEQLELRRPGMSDAEFRRARHVVTEIDRTLQAADSLRCRDWAAVGRLMYASHQSLCHDFEVSCHELDLLVSIAADIGQADGVIGSRMTGAGFGGCTVSLVQRDQVEAVAQTLGARYLAETGIEPDCFSSRPAAGARVIQSRGQRDSRLF